MEGASLLSSPSSGTGRSAIVTIPNTSVSGQVKIRFTVTGLCTTKTFDKTFRVGKAQKPGPISGGTYVYTYHIIPYSVSPVPGATSYNWQVPSGWSGGGSGLGNSITVTVGPTGGDVIVTPVNSCGLGPSSKLRVTVNNCQTCRKISLTPNPANDYIAVIPENPDLDIDEDFEINEYSIYDLNGKLLKFSNQKITGSPKRIEIADLPKGMYILHLVFPDGILAKKIIIDR